MHRRTAILMGITLLLSPLALAAPEGVPDKQPGAPKASDALILTFADAGKTVKLPVGRAIEVRRSGLGIEPR